MSRDVTGPSDNLPPRPAERALIESVLRRPLEGRVLTTTLGRAHLARALVSSQPDLRVDCWFTDLYLACRTDELVGDTQERLRILCQSDPPSVSYQHAFLPLGRAGESEFVRECIQAFYERLMIGGELCVAVNNPRDRWVREQLTRFDRDWRVEKSEESVLYRGRKRNPNVKHKCYDCEFLFRHDRKLLKAHSRPGVFSHRRVDPGARHLMDAMDIESGDRVLDIGCGAGTVSLAAAATFPSVRVVSLDSNARAVQCTQRGALSNQLENVRTALTYRGEFPVGEQFDVVVANPPYYARYEIAERFVEIAHRGLRCGGRVYFVGKHAPWYAAHLPNWFADVEISEVKGYCIATGLRDGGLDP